MKTIINLVDNLFTNLMSLFNMVPTGSVQTKIYSSLDFFIFVLIELTFLFIVISALVTLLLNWIGEERLRKVINRNSIISNIAASTLGALTPFCACSTVPMAKGFLKAKLNIGIIMSFIIASPLLNPIIIIAMYAMIGLKGTIIYFCTVYLGSILFGGLMNNFNYAKYVKADYADTKSACETSCAPKEEKTSCCETKKEEKTSCCSTKKPKEEKKAGPIRIAFRSAIKDYKDVFVYLIIGIAIGAGIYSWVPEEFIAKMSLYIGDYISIPISALIGIPLYIRAETAIPIGMTLINKGMSSGAVVALIIGGAGMAIPEMTMLASIFKKNLIAILVSIIFLTAVVTGILFNLIL